MTASGRQMIVGLIGAGIQASRTPAMHEVEGRAHGLDYRYRLFDLEVLGVGDEALPELISQAERDGFTGLNITHPCKQAVIEYLTDLSDHARAIGAVNTILLRDGRRTGHNTDWSAFAESFRRGLPDAPVQNVVQLGAGGAGAATAYAALKLGVEQLFMFDIEYERAQQLADRLNMRSEHKRIAAVSDLDSVMTSVEGLIHATPTGMASHPGLPLPAQLLRSEMWVAEIVYFPLETELLGVAKAIGCRTLDGSAMAVCQAAEAFRWFTGIVPDAGRMRRCFEPDLE
ncbi:MAG: shikimate dehydrogenase [Betaproteobacteria bacterium]|nr:MAG: shikimate dehydrogenase [Betaproteobacteria bacterium]